MATGGTKVIIQAIGGNGFITILKFIGFLISSSPSMLAEAVHSLADTFNQILLLIGIKQSKKEASRNYSLGMGSATYVWNLISAVGIFFIGFGVTFYHAMHTLLSSDPHQTTFSWTSVIILVISFIIEFWVLMGAYKEVKIRKGNKNYLQFFKDSDDPSILAVLLEDAAAVVGVSLALIAIIVGQLTGSHIFDTIAALMISFIMAFLAIILGIINSQLLLGKSLTINKEETIHSFISSIKEIQTIQKLSTRIIGASQVRLSLEIELYSDQLIDQDILQIEAQKISDGESAYRVLYKNSERMVRTTGNLINIIENRIKEKFPEIQFIDIEIN